MVRVGVWSRVSVSVSKPVALLRFVTLRPAKSNLFPHVSVYSYINYGVLHLTCEMTLQCIVNVHFYNYFQYSFSFLDIFLHLFARKMIALATYLMLVCETNI